MLIHQVVLQEHALPCTLQCLCGVPQLANRHKIGAVLRYSLHTAESLGEFLFSVVMAFMFSDCHCQQAGRIWERTRQHPSICACSTFRPPTSKSWMMDSRSPYSSSKCAVCLQV